MTQGSNNTEQSSSATMQTKTTPGHSIEVNSSKSAYVERGREGQSRNSIEQVIDDEDWSWVKEMVLKNSKLKRLKFNWILSFPYLSQMWSTRSCLNAKWLTSYLIRLSMKEVWLAHIPSSGALPDLLMTFHLVLSLNAFSCHSRQESSLTLQLFR